MLTSARRCGQLVGCQSPRLTQSHYQGNVGDRSLQGHRPGTDLCSLGGAQERRGEVIVRKAGRYGCTDIFDALFPEKAAKSKVTPDVKEGIRKYICRVRGFETIWAKSSNVRM